MSAVFAPIDHEVKQEELVRDIILSEVPNVKVSISKEVANIGTLSSLGRALTHRSARAGERYHPQRFSPVICSKDRRRLRGFLSRARIVLSTFLDLE